jgi:isocitrate lyase
MSAGNDETAEVREWFASDRFAATTRLFSPAQVVAQRGTIRDGYDVARVAAEEFYVLLRELFAKGESITTFGPYSPGQAVAMKRKGIDGIYLGGWATSAKGSMQEDPGPDLAGYPLSQVPDEAAVLVRALLTADRNQAFARSKMTPEELASTPEVNFLPFIIADADTGHGGDPHVRNLIRRFVEVGVPGYHIEDQKPGVKKCGHQGGKVLVGSDEQIKRLNAARFQLDIMGVPGIIVARTDAEAATLLESAADERDQPFVLGVTNLKVPHYKVGYLATLRRLHLAGVAELNGHELYSIPDADFDAVEPWMERSGVIGAIEAAAARYAAGDATADEALDDVAGVFFEAWESDAGLTTYREAAAEAIEFAAQEGRQLDMTRDEWLEFSAGKPWSIARQKIAELGVEVVWDRERAMTPEGYCQVRGDIEYAVAKSLAAAPFADILWMETKTADLEDARVFAEAIHAVFPDMMLAYNLSPSFNWDTTGMTDDEMRDFPTELARLGFVFNFITYGGHQVDGMAGEEFATALQEDGMLALARLQRRLRLLDSPYKTPQTLVGGPRLDAALMASSGRTATTRAMGKGSTQFQHLVQTEVPLSVLDGWLESWSAHHEIGRGFEATLRPYTAGRDLLELGIVDDAGVKVADIVFDTIHDRRGRSILSVRDQNNHDLDLRRKRLMMMLHLFLIRRYDVAAIHYLTPTEDNHRLAQYMERVGIFASVGDEVGDIIVADVDPDWVSAFLAAEEGISALFSGYPTDG